MPPLVFISYSHKDRAEKDELVAYLRVLQNAGLIDIWADDQIEAGADWKAEIKAAISRAKIAILLISANFLNQDYIMKEEVPELLESRANEDLILMPIIARTCTWQAISWLEGVKIWPNDGKPIWGEGHRRVGKILTFIADQIKLIVEKDFDSTFVSTLMAIDSSMRGSSAELPPRNSNESGSLNNHSRPFVYVSYSHKDRAEKDELVAYLRVLQNAGLIDIWVDDQIEVGTDWEAEIKAAISRAKIAILLISANFLSSEFIMKEEVPELLKYRAKGTLTVLPVLARACVWQAFHWLTQMDELLSQGPIWSSDQYSVERALIQVINQVETYLAVTPYNSSVSTLADTKLASSPFKHSIPEHSRPLVYVSYSSADEKEKEVLLHHLLVLQNAGLINIWSDDAMGDDDLDKYIEIIIQKIKEAKVAILLISANYLISDYIQDIEMPQILQRHEEGELFLVPIIARLCPWNLLPEFARMVVRPKHYKPIWKENDHYVDQELTSIVYELGMMVCSLYPEPSSSQVNIARHFQPLIYISYSTNDEKEKEILSSYLKPLQDDKLIYIWTPDQLYPGVDRKQETDQAIAKAKIAILLISPSFLNSGSILNEEIPELLMRRRQEGLIVLPIIIQDCSWRAHDWLNQMKVWPEDHQPIWASDDDRVEKKLQLIAQEITDLVLAKTKYFVERPVQFNRVTDYLLSAAFSKQAPVITLYGEDGSGKTVLAQAVLRSSQIKDKFTDILWVNLGQYSNLFTVIVDQIKKISGDEECFSDIKSASIRLKSLLANRRILLVLDNVCHADQIEPFLVRDNPDYAYLIISRRDVFREVEAQSVAVPAMTIDEATQLLLNWVGQSSNDRQNFQQLAEYLGRWPILLELAAIKLQHQIIRTTQASSLTEAVIKLQQHLADKGFHRFFNINELERNQVVNILLDLILEDIDQWAENYLQLVVFPEEVDIPLVTIARLWAHTTGLNEEASLELLLALQDQDLFTYYDPFNKTVRIHSVIRRCLEYRQSDNLVDLHQDLLEAYQQQASHPELENSTSTLTWTKLPHDEPYMWRYLAFHLMGAQRNDELIATVKDIYYLATKSFLHHPVIVEDDLIATQNVAPTDNTLNLLHHHFVQARHLLTQGQTLNDVAMTLYSRIAQIENLVEISQISRVKPACFPLIPLHPLPDLPGTNPPDPFKRDENDIFSCVFSSDGQFALAACHDNTVKLWDVQTGQMDQIFEGHTGWVRDGALSPDGQFILSASYDNTLILWDIQSKKIDKVFQGHTGPVTGCTFSPDGQYVLSSSWDKSLKLWKAQTGQIMLTFEGHHSYVWDCKFSPDGQYILSASMDKTLKLWDAQTGELSSIFKGHEGGVTACTFSPNGQFVLSASLDGNLNLWDITTSKILQTLKGHLSHVWSCAFSPDGQNIISTSWDKTLKLWSANNGDCLATLHVDGVLNDCDFSPDGQNIVAGGSRGLYFLKLII